MMNWSLWRRWILVNAGADVVGLGGSALLVVALGAALESRWGALTAASSLVVAATLVEGTIIGLAQWLVLRRFLPHLNWFPWVLATMAGVLGVWSVGLAPSTLILLSSRPATGPMPATAMVGSLAVGMGLVLGPLVALPQWRVLRRHVRQAGWWIPANIVAWTVGITIICLGVEGSLGSKNLLSLAWFPVLLAVTGAGVGAVSGLALVWLLRRQPPGS